MKQLKRYIKIAIAVIIIVIIVVPLFNRTTIKTDGYSVDNAYENIKELSSDKYNGRRYGTKENMDAVKYIEEQFKSIGLEPGGENNTYLRNHTENTKIYNGAAVLEIIDRSGNTVKQYKYGEDFIEQSYGYSIPGEVTSGYSILEPNSNSVFDKAKNTNSIAIVNTPDRSLPILKSLCIGLASSDYTALISTVPDSTNLRYESASVGDRLLYKSGYEMPALVIKDRVSKELINYNNDDYKLHIKSTFDVAPALVPDVLGVIPGKGNTLMIISSHLDHVGPSSDGTVYPGALDNASGVGTMIELARFIKSQGKVPSQTIVFIAFNGEEGGLLGSSNYVHKTDFPLYSISSVINLDMIGSNKDVPLTIMYNSVHSTWIDETMDPSSKLRYQIRSLSERLGISTKEVDETSSDHTMFNSAAVPAITLMDYDAEKIHSPFDNMDNVGKKNIDRTLNLVANYISITVYSNVSSHGYSIGFQEIMDFIKALYPLLIGLAAALVLFYLYYRKRKSDPKSRGRSVPILGILIMIILIGVIGYFPTSYQSAPFGAAQVPSLIGNGFIYIFKSLLTLPLFILFLAPSLLILYIFDHRIRGWNYEGDAKEYDIAYYASILVFLAASLYLSYMYSGLCYLTFTPDFARYTEGRLIVYAIIALLSYLVSVLICFEKGVKKRSYASLITFALIFFILLSAFFTPISTNRFVLDLNYRNVDTHSPNAFD